MILYALQVKICKNKYGELAERSKAAVLKATRNRTVYAWDLYFGYFAKSLINRHFADFGVSKKMLLKYSNV